MSPRAYSLGKRASSAEATRKRILDAIVALHADRGIVATTPADIAARADVAIGTVTRYFPSVDTMVRGCGGYLSTIAPLPAETVLDAAVDTEARIHALCAAWYAFYDARGPWLRNAYTDAPLVPALGESIARANAHRIAMVQRALDEGTTVTDDIVRVAVAVTGAPYWQTLTDAGMPSAEAAALTADMLLAWLRHGTLHSGKDARHLWKRASPRSPIESTDSRRTSPKLGRADSRSTSS